MIFDPDIELFLCSNNIRITRNSKGYAMAKIDGKKILIHRYIMKAKLGEFIDHINGDPSDNRLCNLRKATLSQNQFNRKMAKNNRSGVKGVWFENYGKKWVACIWFYKKRYRKKFKNFNDAVLWRKKKEIKLYKSFNFKL